MSTDRAGRLPSAGGVNLDIDLSRQKRKLDTQASAQLLAAEHGYAGR